MTKKKTAEPTEIEPLADDGKRIKWSLENWKIKDLIPHPKNPRIISDDGLNALGESFDEIGFAQPININTDGTILSGHARVMKLKKEGAKTVDCYVPDRKLTPKQEEAVLIRMNKNVAGKWDFNALSNWNVDDLKDYGFEDFELMGLGNLGDINSSDESSEWVGMPDFTPQADTLKIIIHFDSDIERADFAKEFDLKFKKKAGRVWSTCYPFREGDDLASLKYEEDADEE